MSKVNYDYDFSGWATKFDVKCADGRIIKKSAFVEEDGKVVPVMWNHQHDTIDACLGHALLESRNDGIYAYVKLNDETDGGKQAKALIKHGDIKSLSIYANKLKQKGSEVVHGIIRELSLCIAGANSGAVVDHVLAHAEEDAFDVDGIIVYAGDENPIIAHSADSEDEDISESEANEDNNDESTKDLAAFEAAIEDLLAHADDEPDKEDSDETVEDVINTMTDKQKKAMLYMMDQAVKEAKDEMSHSLEEEETDMKVNLFEGAEQTNVLAHSAEYCGEVMQTAAKFGSLKDACLAHAADYGIDDIEMLFSDARNYTQKPEFISRRMEWVAKVMNGVGRSPFSRVKTMFADITEDEARARGYIKGNRKVEEVFTLLKRETTPTTIYKKQKIDRDDILDITDFSVVEFIKAEMRVMYEEECARAILVGDGRSPLSPDKVNPNNIRPIWTDDDLFTIKQTVPVASSASDSAKAKAFIKNVIKSRKLYRGSGNPTLFTTEDMLADMLLIEDGIGHYLYSSQEQLKNILRVSDIVTVPVMEDLSRQDGDTTKYLAGIIVNLSDYKVGADKGANVNFFDDFDIDFNQYKYLMESRFSGALVKPYSALVYEIAYSLTLDTDPEDPSTTVLGKSVNDLQSGIYVHDSSISGTLNYVTGYTQYSTTPELQSGNYLALKFTSSDSATVTVQTIGGDDDSKVVTVGGDDNVVVRVKSNRMKLKVTSTLGDDVITKIYALGGLKLLNA